jgi:hypothetical protein
MIDDLSIDPTITPNIDPQAATVLWEPPTMKSVQQLEGNPLVRCACGRMVNADMMRVLGDGFACDSCHETLFRTGQLTSEEFVRSHDAPDSVIEKATLQDAAKSAAAAELAATRGTLKIQ